MGDLNYRVEVADDVLRAWCDEEKWNLALEKDQVRLLIKSLYKEPHVDRADHCQLKADIASGKSFSGFNEHPIDFPPYVPTITDTRRS